MKLSPFIVLAFAVGKSAFAFDYNVVGAGEIVLTDVKTGISPLQTIFTGSPVDCAVEGIEWEATNSTDGSQVLLWETLVDGKVQASGTYPLDDVGRELPTGLPVGTIEVGQNGRSTITVVLSVNSEDAVTESTFEVYAAGVAIVPLLVIFFLAVATRMVELSLFTGVFVGACIVAGNLKEGFKTTLDTYILEALADPGHVFVILFTLFLSGMVGMMQKSGGMQGAAKDISRFATTARLGQLACFAVGLMIFFDDYANLLLAGESMRPLLDMLCVSREKLAFIVDGTSAPIASLSPISSWVGFEISLIQEQIDRLSRIYGDDQLTIPTSGFTVFLQSIKYRYYPIFMLMMMILLIAFDRDFGPMLIAERKTRVYERVDGGDGRAKSSATQEMDGKGENAPRKDTPSKSWNMFVPVFLLVALVFYLLVKSGTTEGEEQTFLDKIQGSDSYVALLWGTMAAALCTMFFYLLQIVQDGNLVLPTWPVLRALFSWKKVKTEDESDPCVSKPRPLMSVKDTSDSFLYGMSRIFSALIILTLAWACGSIMTAVGADRLFSSWIASDIDPSILPTLSFVISFIMALATGTSWGTMSILFPLMLVPTYEASNGDVLIFYATVAGVLSGSVAGDHVSPISDTTVISAMSCECDLLSHVWTQAPYSLIAIVLSIVVGTVPVGYGAFPNIVSILLGFGIVAVFVYFYCRPVLSATGRLDLLTELALRFRKKGGDDSLLNLREDTVRYFNGEKPNRKPVADERTMELSCSALSSSIEYSSSDEEKLSQEDRDSVHSHELAV